MMLLLVLLVFCSTGSYWITAYETGDCGIRYNFKLTIARGKDSKPNQYPWHVGIYRRDNSSKYEYICGGSIIYGNVIATAAHCVFDENTKDIDYNRMVVAVGKHNSSWERIDESEQRFEVMDKRIPQRYKGTENMNDNDIALLALNDSISFSDRVMPVCMDWSRTKEPYDGENCTFVGWGYEENRNLTELLQVSEMLLRNFDECRKSVGQYFTSYLTSDKFCTISKDNSMVEKGDSGGGLVFARMQNDNDTGARYYLKGILNGREKGNDVTPNFLYTNVSNHMPWIRSTLDAIRDETDANKICGRRPINTTVTVNYVTRYEEYPWIATIVMSKNNKFFGIRCAGTIIHKRAVITSYWCVRDTRPHYKGVQYKIIVGKNELNMKEVDDNQQEFMIAHVHKHQLYVDWTERVENEMVILILDRDIKYNNDTVLPICIDRSRRYPIEDSSPGMVASWDIDECHCQVMARYGYLAIENCSQAFADDKEYETYITSEKICGRYMNGSQFMHGSEIGSGYFFLKGEATKEKRHYLHGIVSQVRPTHKEYLAFTNVELNLRWINDVLTNLYNNVDWTFF